MKYMLTVLASLVFSTAVFAADVIIKEADGQWVPAPDGYKAVFVPADTGDTLVEVRGIELVEPGAGWTPGESLPGGVTVAKELPGVVVPQRETCNLPGTLSLGGNSCLDCPDGYTIEPGFGADRGYCLE